MADADTDRRPFTDPLLLEAARTAPEFLRRAWDRYRVEYLGDKEGAWLDHIRAGFIAGALAVAVFDSLGDTITAEEAAELAAAIDRGEVAVYSGGPHHGPA